MNKKNLILISILIIALIIISGCEENIGGEVYKQPNSISLVEYNSNELLIKFKLKEKADNQEKADKLIKDMKRRDKSLSSISETKPLFSLTKNKQIKNEIGLNRWYKIRFETQVDLLEEIEKYIDKEEIEYVELNYIYHTSFTPNDNLFSQQWALNNIGQTGGTNDADIDAIEAWDLEQGSEEIIIAIIDTGIDYQHPDLSQNILANAGYDFVNLEGSDLLNYCDPSEDCTIEDNDPLDIQGHGTHCAGIVSAVTNNDLGIAGACPNCKILPIRAGWKNTIGGGSLLNEDVVQSLEYAIDNNWYGADIISMSFGGPYSEAIRDAVDYVYSQNVILIAAAGNDGIQIRKYPAALHNVIAVAATDHNNQKASFSNYGYWIDIAAPGEDILSTIPGNNYASYSGTSMATPIIAGITGLLLSNNPGFDQHQLKTALLNGVDMISSEYYIGSGMTNAYNSLILENVPSMNAEIVEISPSFYNYFVNPNQEEVTIVGSAFSDQSFSYTLSYQDSEGNIEIINQGNDNIINNILGVWDVSSLEQGEYLLKLKVISGDYVLSSFHYVFIAPANVLLPIPTRTPLSIGDIDKDYEGLEFAFVGRFDGKLYVYHYDGTPVVGFPQDLGGQSSYESPSIGDIDNDGYLEIVIGPFESDKLYAFNHDGSYLNNNWPITLPTYQASTVVLIDTNNDGFLESIFTTLFGGLYIYDQFGEQLLFIDVGYSGISPTVADIDNDGVLEILVVESSGDYSTITIYDINGNIEQGWPVTVEGRISKELVVGNIHKETPNLEIVGISSNLYPTEWSDVHVWTANGYELGYQWPRRMNDSLNTGASLANIINNTGPGGDYLEIMFGIDNQVHIFDYTGTEIMGNWPVIIDTQSYYNPPVSADLDGNNKPEIVIGTGGIFSGHGKIYTIHKTGDILNLPLDCIGGLTSPVISDLDNDGKMEIIAGSTSLGIYLIQLDWDSDPLTMEWSQFQHDERHTGNYDSQCTDKTFIDECSSNRPKYCEEGILVDNCQECGCSPGKICQEDGSCILETQKINNTTPQTR